MEILMLLIPLSAFVVIGAAVVFFRAVDSGQFDDLERNGRATLFEEPRAGESDAAVTLRKPQ
jgi:cbb3-type cytochrome oxidase maturation protein